MLLIFIACWAIVLGVFQIIGAIRLRKEIDNEWTLILGGALSVLFGLVLLVAPGAGAVGLIWVIAAYAIVFGVLLVMAGVPAEEASGRGMKFGLFGSAQAKRGGSDLNSAQGFRDFIDYNVEAEALGYDSTSWSSIISPASARCRRASICSPGWRRAPRPCGSAPPCWCCPGTIRCCSPSRPRRSICSPAGGSNSASARAIGHNEFAGFCIPIAEADERFEESLRVILKAWTSDERFSHHGKYWNFENIVVEPPTRQKPHPPIWMAAGQPDSIRKVAQRGAKLLLDQFASIARRRSSASTSTRPRWRRSAAASTRWMSASRARSMWRRMPTTSARRSRRGSPTSGA